MVNDLTSVNGLRSPYDNRWFVIFICYFIIDLARPQEIFPIIGPFKIGMISTVMLACFLGFSGRLKLSIYGQGKYILFFAILLGGYILWAENNFRAYIAFRSIGLMLPFLLSTLILIDCRNRLLMMCKVYAWLLAFMSVYSIFHAGLGPGGILGDENDLCLMLVTFFPLVLFVALQENRKSWKCFWMIVVVMTAIAVVYTKSRGGFVGFIGMALVYWWFSRKKILLMFGFVLLAVVMLVVGGESYKNDMETIADPTENTANIRLLSWQAGWNMFLDHPFGVGGNNFAVHFPDYQPEGLGHNMWGREAHSLWFTLIPDTGVIGIFLFLLIVKTNFADLKYLRKIDGDLFFPQLSIALYASFAGFFGAATFISVLYYPYFWYLSVLTAAAKYICEHSSEVLDAT